MRAFFAIALPDQVRAAAWQASRRLREQFPRFRWVAQENLHLTLVFLDEITDEQRSACEAAARARVRTPRFGLQLGGWGMFPARGHARAVWVGVDEGTRSVAALAEALTWATGDAGIAVDPPGRFHSHVTLGRVAQASPRGLDRALVELPPWSSQQFTVSAATLYESRLTPQGPRYEPLASLPLA